MGKKWLFSGSWDKTVIIWDVGNDTPKILKRIAVNMQARCLRLTAFREQLVIGSFQGKIAIWTVANLSNCQLVSEKNPPN